MIPDFHTHIDDGTGIVSMTPDQLSRAEGLHSPVSVGIHPWHTADEPLIERQLAMLPTLLDDSRVVALGETGIDTLKGASPERQAEIMALQVALAEEKRLPVIVHAVRSLDRITALYDRLKPTTPWTIHGITGRASQIEKLAERGIYMSVGPRTPDTVAAMIPDHLLLLETDSEPGRVKPLDEVIARVARARNQSTDTLSAIVAANLGQLLQSHHHKIAFLKNQNTL